MPAPSDVPTSAVRTTEPHAAQPMPSPPTISPIPLAAALPAAMRRSRMSATIRAVFIPARIAIAMVKNAAIGVKFVRIDGSSIRLVYLNFIITNECQAQTRN